MVVTCFSAMISPACLSTLKCPESVDRASGNRSAISPAVISRRRNSRRISRRVGSPRLGTLRSLSHKHNVGISPTSEIIEAIAVRSRSSLLIQ